MEDTVAAFGALAAATLSVVLEAASVPCCGRLAWGAAGGTRAVRFNVAAQLVGQSVLLLLLRLLPSFFSLRRVFLRCLLVASVWRKSLEALVLRG